jgi:hypothetical protein
MLAFAGALTLSLFGTANAAVPGWQDMTFNAETPGSSTVEADGTWKITAQSGDTWEREDSFHVVYKPLAGDGSVSTKLLDVPDGAEWSKVGVMMRNDLTNKAAAVMQLHMTTLHGGENLIRGISDPDNGDSGLGVTRMSKNAKMTVAGDGSQVVPREFPVWLRIVRQGDTFTAYARKGDTDVWTPVSFPQKIAMGNEIVAGVFVTSNNGGSDPLTATYSGSEVSNTLPKPEEAIPVQPYPVTATGGANSVLLTWAPVTHFGQAATGYVVYKAKPGETTFTKLADVPGDKSSYIDETIKDGEIARYQVTTVVTVGDKTLESKPYAAGNKLLEVTGAANAPLKIGDRDFFSSVLDGGNERPLNETPGAATVDANGVVTLVAAGWDIQERADGGQALTTPVTGDFTLTARILGVPTALEGDVSTWAKFGIMVRENLLAEGRYAAMLVTPDHGIRSPHSRGFTNGWSDDVGPNEDILEGPVTLQIKRVGDTISFFRSDDDGKTFQPYGAPETLTLPKLNAQVHVGLVGTAHNIDTTEGQKAQIKVDKITITTP